MKTALFCISYPASTVSFDLLRQILPLPDLSRKIEGDCFQDLILLVINAETLQLINLTLLFDDNKTCRVKIMLDKTREKQKQENVVERTI